MTKTRCCCGKYEISEPMGINNITHEPLGPEGNFCGPYIHHLLRDLEAEKEEAERERDQLRAQIQLAAAVNEGIKETNRRLNTVTDALVAELQSIIARKDKALKQLAAMAAGMITEQPSIGPGWTPITTLNLSPTQLIALAQEMSALAQKALETAGKPAKTP